VHAGLIAAALSVGLVAWQAVAPASVGAFGFTIDRLSTVLGCLVAIVGAVVLRFADRALLGDPRRLRYLRSLALASAGAFALMFATNLVAVLLAWAVVSWGLHRLLVHAAERPEAWRVARTKFVVSRVGDAFLVAGGLVLWFGLGTLDLDRLAAAAAAAPVAGETAAVLLVLGALAKSAQVPFHAWLPDTMEAPTPTSAIMHAGIINAGGALLVRIAPFVVQFESALLLLSVVGTATVLVAFVAMWAQPSIKRSLAWSTVGQMGFMTTQLGLAAAPAALLHILGHGFYKAWSFLRSGDLPMSRPAAIPDAAPAAAASIAWFVVGVLAAFPAFLLASTITGFSPWHAPGEAALAIIVALAIGHLWRALVERGRRSAAQRVVLASVATIAAPMALFALYRGASMWLAPVHGAYALPAGSLAWAAALLPVAAFSGLSVLHACLPLLGRSRRGRAFFVHAMHGFHLGAPIDRVGDVLGRLVIRGPIADAARSR
jgi:NAD(P)H-quinone oxidoreductase subunit 5